MGAWYYCQDCGNGGDQPTLRDIIAGKQACGVCHKTRLLSQSDKELAAEYIDSRLADVEKQLKDMNEL